MYCLRLHDMRNLIALTLFVLSTPCLAQLELVDFFSSKTSSYELKVLDVQEDFVSSHNFNSPLLREVEFRMRSRDLQSSPDDFRLRFAPINPWERKANKAYLEVLRQQLSSERRMQLSQLLSRRYRLIIELKYLQEVLAFTKRKDLSYRNLINAYTKKENSGKEILRLKKRLVFNELQSEELVGRVERVQNEISMTYTPPETWVLPDLIQPEQIQIEIQNEALSNNNLMIQNEMNKSILSEAEWQINKSESFSNMGFLQAEYRPDTGLPFSEALGWQLGFQLPIFNRDRPDLQRRKLGVIEDQVFVEQQKQEVDLLIFDSESILRAYLRQYEKIQNALRSTGSMDSDISNVDLLLELDELKSDLEGEKIDVYRKILDSYVNWMEVTGNLVSEPMVNHVDPKKTNFSLENN